MTAKSSWKSKTMAAAFPKKKFPTPNQWACSICANARPCLVATSELVACPEPKEPASKFPSHSDALAIRNTTMRILLADDHAVVRRRLKQILADEGVGVGWKL